MSSFGQFFFHITDVFCAKKRVGYACICPRNHAHWLATFENIPPPKSLFFAAKKMETPHWKQLFLSMFSLKNQVNFFVFFGSFFRKFRHADLDSREQQGSCSKKWKISGQTRVFLYVSGEKIVTLFSTFANNNRSYTTNSTTPDRLRFAIGYTNKRWFFSWFLPIFLFEHRHFFNGHPI